MCSAPKTSVPASGRSFLCRLAWLVLVWSVIASATAQEVTFVSPPMPATLTVFAPTLLEISRINVKATDPARVDAWDLDASGQLLLPAPEDFAVRVAGRAVNVTRVGFKRRAAYAPLRTRDLRVANWLYLELAAPVATDETVEVTLFDARLATPALTLTAIATLEQPSTALHVNQQGYLPDLPKVAFVGAFLGTLGELTLPANTAVELVAEPTGAVVWQGTLTRRADLGFTMSPLPYQQVLAADFSAVTRPGRYHLRVPGLGISDSFLIAEDVAGALARTYALGLFHQRCGTELALPFTRFTHGLDHAAPAAVPTMDFTFTTRVLTDMTADFASNPRHTAPRLANVDASLYPFVNQGAVDVSGGHHDAGDYSKYTINSAGLVHHLVFAADVFPGVASLDNLGLPESGDGRSDLLQEAQREADFLLKMQDADGGFYFLVYPRDRKYEDNVLPDRGDPQVVFPKNTSATAAATAALAQMASSPSFRAQSPATAARYLAAARNGWAFLQRAIARYGRDGAYQKISHYGDVFMHDDELAWAAAELFAATGEAEFEADLKAHFDPNVSATRRWTWWRLFEGYGAAVRSYAFAARTGRLPAARLDADYLARCERELVAAAEDVRRWSDKNAYGTSFPDASKRQRSAGWYFSAARAFDLAVALQLDARPQWLTSLVSHVNYEAGANPLNLSFITGLGAHRPTVLISQYALNDHRALPPSGFPIGQLQTGFSYLDLYKKEMSNLNVPSDAATNNAYPLYDRWGDTWNTSTEAVVVDQARGLATMAFLMARTGLRTQAWRAQAAEIVLTPGATAGTWNCSLAAGNLDLSGATILWETATQAGVTGSEFTYTVTRTGEQWIEAEAQLPDGRRVFAATRFLAAAAPAPALPTLTLTATDAEASQSPVDLGRFELARTGDVSQPLTVAYGIAGTARNGTDYGWINGSQYNVTAGTATFAAGVSRLPLTVTPKTVVTLTNDKTVVLTLCASNTYNVALPHQATVVIRAPRPANHPPVAQNVEARFEANPTVPITLVGTDPDQNQLEYVLLTQPTGGLLYGQAPNLIYVPGPAFTGTDQFTYYVHDGQLASTAAVVTVTREFNTSVGVYPFNTDLNDGLGHLPALTPFGQARLIGGALRFDALDDVAVAALPAETLRITDQTSELAFEARLYVDAFLSYGKATVPLLRLYRGWNSFLELRQDKWARSAQVKGGTVSVTSTEALAAALTPNQWHHLSLRVTTAGYRVFVDGQLISSVASTDLNNWRPNAPLALEVGHFAGWLDWLEVRVTQRPAGASSVEDVLEVRSEQLGLEQE